MPKQTIRPDLQAWIDARKRHRLSHAQVKMARELGQAAKRQAKALRPGAAAASNPEPAPAAAEERT